MSGIGKQSERALVWSVGLDERTIKEITELFGVKVFEVPHNADQVFDLDIDDPEIILSGDNVAPKVRTELVQIIGLKYSKVPFYHIVRDIKKCDWIHYLKEGLTDAFFLPFERMLFEEALNQQLAAQETVVKRTYETVRLVDINPAHTIYFDLNVFLRANRKFICVAKKGSKVGAERMNKLRDKMATVYVTKDDMKDFYNYVEATLQKKSAEGHVSATERKRNLVNSVKKLIRGVLNESKENIMTPQVLGKLLEDAKMQLHDSFLTTSFRNFHDKFLEIYGDRFDHSYVHACNVAMYAAFFSMGTNIGNPMELATAGLLHDVGMALIDEKVQLKPFENLDGREISIYQSHVQKSINRLRSVELKISQTVMDAISQHHEQSCGRGFPFKLKNDLITSEAQILSIADYFDELTSYTDSRGAMTPRKAINYIIAEEEKLVGRRRFDRDILDGVKELFAVGDKNDGKKAG